MKLKVKHYLDGKYIVYLIEEWVCLKDSGEKTVQEKKAFLFAGTTTECESYI